MTKDNKTTVFDAKTWHGNTGKKKIIYNTSWWVELIQGMMQARLNIQK